MVSMCACLLVFAPAWSLHVWRGRGSDSGILVAPKTRAPGSQRERETCDQFRIETDKLNIGACKAAASSEDPPEIFT